MSLLFPRLASGGDEVVLRVGSETRTSADLARVAGALTAALPPRARIAIWTQPSIDTLTALVAAAAAGFELVPFDPKLGPLELNHVARDAGASIAIAAEPSAVAGRLPLETRAFSELAAMSPAAVTWRSVDDQPLLVLYTSGTTGLPKGAVLTSRNVAFNLDGLAAAWKWTRADVVVNALPLFHVHGLVLGLYGSVRVGGSVHWFPRFVPGEIAAALEHGAVLFAVPTMYHRLSEAAETDPSIARGLAGARLLVSGSAALPQRDQARVESLSGRRVIERYGLTETLINCAVRAESSPSPGSVGPPVDGIELKLVDDQRATIEAFDDATLGEVAVRGPNVFSGYLNRPDATAAVKDADGWFYTGDIAARRADGSIRIVGRRATDLIKCGGYKVGAGEVEAALLEHPHVREAAVVGRPDADLGEKIVAFVVVSQPTEAKTLEDFVASQLSPHKRPRVVNVVSELPRNAMGKLVKTKLP